MQKLFTEIGEKNLKIDHGSDSKEMRCLLEIPYMPRKLAKLLCEHSINSVNEFVAVAPAAVVQLLQLSIGFEVQVRKYMFVSVCHISKYNNISWRHNCDP